MAQTRLWLLVLAAALLGGLGMALGGCDVPQGPGVDRAGAGGLFQDAAD